MALRTSSFTTFLFKLNHGDDELLDDVPHIPAAVPARLARLRLSISSRGPHQQALRSATRRGPGQPPAPKRIPTEIRTKRRRHPGNAAVRRHLDRPNSAPAVECDSNQFTRTPAGNLSARRRGGKEGA